MAIGVPITVTKVYLCLGNPVGEPQVCTEKVSSLGRKCHDQLQSKWDRSKYCVSEVRGGL